MAERPVPRETREPLDRLEEAIVYAMRRAAMKRRAAETRAKMPERGSQGGAAA